MTRRILSALRALAVLGAATLLTACENMATVASSAGQALAKVAASATQAPPSGGAAAAGATGTTAAAGTPANAAAGAAPARPPGTVRNGIRGSELDDIFKKNPVSNTNNPQVWPRVAITIKSATAGVFNLPGAGSLGADDCVTFDIRLWRSASDGRKFENMQLCVDAVQKEAKGVAFRNLDLLPRFTVHRNMNSTAAQRTEGPNPPHYVFPQDIRSMQGWPMSQTNARYFLGAILLSLGWDWDNDFDRRLWVVSVVQSPAGY